MAKRKEIILPPALSRLPFGQSPEAATPPEEPRFFGEAFVKLMQNYRKAGTLREQHPKRAGLTKGMRIMGHVSVDAQSPSVDIPLVILDVYHGPLKNLVELHHLPFLLDGIDGLDPAIRVLQNFSQNQIHAFTEVDYFTFTYQALFDALKSEERMRLLSLPVEQAMVDPAFNRLFYPTLCQAAIWHGYGALEWIALLKKLKAIDSKKATNWINYQIPDSQATQGPARYMTNGPMQEVLDLYDPQAGPSAEYRFLVLGELDAFEQEIS